ncbi:BMP family ABC transporter substrate-binding protein [Nocardia yamanashiensis]|uniref:BMP family ABC transporter substrate-binding protein n=1 Tax=Nocardia yamanashiensis TaxID=209247 RepID=UPI0008359AB4|nr:BMP family ABC transporter substrate-binding protein [Nocardia yamanashiensis]UGT42124.1 BMP family ABC transporter substrate-binding protein [Nocardia yamanashiensis]
MKKIALALLTLAVGATAACSAGNDDAGTKLKVGVLFPGSLSDDGFMQSGYEGYQRIEKSLADKVALTKVEQVAAADYQQVLTRLASTSTLVVSFGGQTDSAVKQVAQAFPNVKFVEVGGPADAVPPANLAYYDPVQADGGFLAGAYAALTSKSGKIGFVGGMELPAIVKTARAFEQGAKHIRADISVLAPVYVGDFNDVAKAKQAAQADVGAGADVFGQQLNLGRQGLAQAAKEGGAALVGGPLVKACGSEAGFTGYVKSDTGAELEYAVNAVLDNTFKAEQVRFGIASSTGATDIVLCGADAQVTAAMAKVKQDLAAGTIKIS